MIGPNSSSKVGSNNSSIYNDYIWFSMNEDGWGVAITYRSSTNLIDINNVYTYIDNKSIVSM